MPPAIFIVGGAYATLLAAVVLVHYLKRAPALPRHVSLMAASWIALMVAFNICKSDSPFPTAVDVCGVIALVCGIAGLHILLPRLK